MATPADAGLAESAALAYAQAPALCRRDPATRETCAWHHGLWPTLRLLGMATEPALHGEFLRSALAALAPAGTRPRILLSGAADHALLALALAARGARGAHLTVLDICETPLMLNRRFAQYAGADSATHRADILDFEVAEPFHAICTHAFLGNFDASRRPALVARWRALLAPGGRVVTVNRLRPGRSGRITFDEQQVNAYRARVLHAAKSGRHALPMSLAELGGAAERYARRQFIYPLQTADELRALFEDGGFSVEHLSVAPLGAPARAGISVPTMPGADDYAHLIAVRR